MRHVCGICKFWEPLETKSAEWLWLGHCRQVKEGSHVTSAQNHCCAAFERKEEGMKEHSFEKMVESLAKDGELIRSEITADDAHALHMIMGVAGEVGELLDAIKKSIFYRKPLDAVNVVEELGDIEFYLEGLRQGLCIDRDGVIEANMRKLGRRYHGYQYSDKRAIDRADKAAD